MSHAARFLLLLTPKATVTAFAPTDLSNLKEWLKADAGTWQDNGLTTAATADGDPVGGWVDQSGAGKNALQGTTAAKPTLKLGANGINGKAALSFDGGDDLTTAAFTAALSQPNTIYVVAKQASVGAYHIFYDGEGAGSRNQFYADNVNKYSLYGGNTIAESVGSANTNAHLLVAQFNGASSSFWRDNSLLLSGDVGAFALSGLYIGMNFTQNLFLTGLFAEILVYNAAHTPTQRGQVQTYLATKYGITLAP